jgi:hypothetical protein
MSYEYFSNIAIERLIKEPDYLRKYLSPRTAEIGIVFAVFAVLQRLVIQILKNLKESTILLINGQKAL